MNPKRSPGTGANLNRKSAGRGTEPRRMSNPNEERRPLWDGASPWGRVGRPCGRWAGWVGVGVRAGVLALQGRCRVVNW